MLNQNLRQNFCNRTIALAQTPGVKTLVNGSPSGHAGMTPVLMETSGENWKSQKAMHEEAFGPGALVVRCGSVEEALDCVDHLEGNLTGSVHVAEADGQEAPRKVIAALEQHVGRVIVNGYPTGVEVNNAIVHGGPYPATTDANSTSVGSAAIRRFVRMVAYQDAPDALLPAALKNANPLGIERVVNGRRTRDPI
jgi:NADP-dependent aldehyde dehydrogenase